MAEINRQQRHFYSYIEKYQNLLKGVVQEIEDYVFSYKSTPKSELPHFDSWPKLISQKESDWIVYNFVPALCRSENISEQVISSVKAANDTLLELTDLSGFEECLSNEILSKKKIASLFYVYDLLNGLVPSKITLADIKEEALDCFKNSLEPKISRNYPLFSFAYSAIQHAFSLYDGLQKKFTKNSWQDCGIAEFIFKPYFLLEQCCEKVPDEAVLLKCPDKVENVWIVRNDRFLPKEWPEQTDIALSSMTHAAIAFVINTYGEASKAFEKVDMSSVIIYPEPSRELWNILERLFGAVPHYYKDIDFDNLLKDVHKEIEYEYGLYGKQQTQNANKMNLAQKKESKKVNNSELRKNKNGCFEEILTEVRSAAGKNYISTKLLKTGIRTLNIGKTTPAIISKIGGYSIRAGTQRGMLAALYKLKYVDKKDGEYFYTQKGKEILSNCLIDS